MLIGFRRHIALVAVAATALLLTLALTGGALASSLFQSSLPPVLTPLPTIFAPTPQPPDDIVPTATQPVLPAATPEPVVEPVLPTPTPSGFLPAPTLTNPDLLPAGQPRAGGSAAAPDVPIPIETTVAAGQATGGSAVALLIDRLVATLSYVWLCCGGLVLAAAALAFVLLSRRASQR